MDFEGLREQDVPTVAQYARALERLSPLPEEERAILSVHYEAPSRTISAEKLAQARSYGHLARANLIYGNLGRKVAEIVGFPSRDGEILLGSLVMFSKPYGRWLWTMRLQVAAALEELGWVDPTSPSAPEEVAEPGEFREGATTRVFVNSYERSPSARRACLDYYGTACVVCGCDFGSRYGSLADGFIHVHHVVPLSQLEGAYQVDPVRDLRPVCPNCHAVIHMRNPPFGVEEVKQFLRERGTATLEPDPTVGDVA